MRDNTPKSLEEILNPPKKEEDISITLDQLRKAVPTSFKANIKQETVDTVNNLLTTGDLKEIYRDNILGYTRVLMDGKFKFGDYLNAVRYVSYKLMGESNIVAYTKTFPDRYQNFLDKGYSARDIAAQVSGYNSSILVTKLLEQSIIPSWIANQDLYQKALNVQADLMLNSKSDKVRTDAANSLLSHLKMPEVAKVSLDVNVKEDDSISELRRSTLELVKQQRLMIESGVMNAKQIAHSKIITDAEYSVVDE